MFSQEHIRAYFGFFENLLLWWVPLNPRKVFKSQSMSPWFQCKAQALGIYQVMTEFKLHKILSSLQWAVNTFWAPLLSACQLLLSTRLYQNSPNWTLWSWRGSMRWGSNAVIFILIFNQPIFHFEPQPRGSKIWEGFTECGTKTSTPTMTPPLSLLPPSISSFLAAVTSNLWQYESQGDCGSLAEF